MTLSELSHRITFLFLLCLSHSQSHSLSLSLSRCCCPVHSRWHCHCHSHLDATTCHSRCHTHSHFFRLTVDLYVSLFLLTCISEGMCGCECESESESEDESGDREMWCQDESGSDGKSDPESISMRMTQRCMVTCSLHFPM